MCYLDLVKEFSIEIGSTVYQEMDLSIRILNLANNETNFAVFFQEGVIHG
jgi:hypothetical protein